MSTFDGRPPSGRAWLPAVLALLVAGCGRNAGQQAAPPGAARAGLLPLPIPFVGDVIDTLNKQGTTRTEVFKRGDEALEPPAKACEVSG